MSDHLSHERLIELNEVLKEFIIGLSETRRKIIQSREDWLSLEEAFTREEVLASGK